jgi:phosphoribosylanthranilate isomerase
MEPIIKICGLSTQPAVDAAVRGGASHLGFIFFPKSPRNVLVERAASLKPAIRNVKTVAVTVDAGNQTLDQIVSEMKPDLLQLHGEECAGRVAEINSRYGLPTIKALAIRQANDFDKIAAYESVASMLLLDAKPPVGSELPGGNGVTFDWSLIANLETRLPVLLSGGIELSNVEDAMDFVEKDNSSISGIDVSSGVESAPGVKDIFRINTFLATCKRRSLQD